MFSTGVLQRAFLGQYIRARRRLHRHRCCLDQMHWVPVRRSGHLAPMSLPLSTFTTLCRLRVPHRTKLPICSHTCLRSLHPSLCSCHLASGIPVSLHLTSTTQQLSPRTIATNAFTLCLLHARSISHLAKHSRHIRASSRKPLGHIRC